MSASVAHYLYSMEERQKALRSNLQHVEEGVGVPANSSLKRCLFGEPDSMELQRKYEEMHREEMRQKEKKWGFNFETETPTDNSRYQWERVSSDVPASHAMPQLGPSQATPLHLEESAEVSTAMSEEIASPSLQPSSSNNNTTGTNKQSLITDFMPQKRHAGPVQGGTTGKRQRSPPSPQMPSAPATTAAGGNGDPTVGCP